MLIQFRPNFSGLRPVTPYHSAPLRYFFLILPKSPVYICNNFVKKMSVKAQKQPSSSDHPQFLLSPFSVCIFADVRLTRFASTHPLAGPPDGRLQAGTLRRVPGTLEKAFVDSQPHSRWDRGQH